MLVYRDGGRRVNSRAELARLRRAAEESPRSRDTVLSLLIQIGEFESGLADAVAPERDAIHQTTSALRALTEDAAAAWLDSVEREAPRNGSLARRLTQFEGNRLPNSIEVRVSEGYAYYALFPESYVSAATAFATATGARRIHAIGIRSIGTSLSAVVVSALRRLGRTVSSSTVRPHGHPFDRRLDVDASLEGVFRSEAERDAWFAIVDEGPGLSGSSFAAVATYLRSLSIPAARIVFFPSWDPDVSTLRSETAARIWNEHSRYCASPNPSLTPAGAFGVTGQTIDFSAGQWRSTLTSRDGWPAVQPQHERLKAFVPDSRRIIRFAGLGAYGHAIAERAATLFDLGVAESPGELRSGFLDLPFVAGVPLARCESVEDAAAVGTYIARVAGAFSTGAAADTATLLHMIETNLGGLLPALHLEAPRDLPAAALDGRMLAHEWIRTDRGLAKIDALDHYAGHFLPGPQSPAWDLAGAEIELRMNEPQANAVLDAFERTSGDRSVRRSLPFYRLAYAAFRFGYATLAAQTLDGTDDAARFVRAAKFYSQCALNAAACFTASPH